MEDKLARLNIEDGEEEDAAMKNMTANLWHSLGGVEISNLNKDKDPLQVPLGFSPFWVQIHDLPPGYFSEAVARQLGTFIRRFLEYDSKQINRDLKGHLRIQVEIDARKPLKRRKKIALPSSKYTYVNFRYEKLTLFCFYCGCLGHNDK
ncbi:hypothetical protein Gohar_024758, partial [Gossypium harknessii]|nr:hypothetical protein [Gossypium harknessii]